MLEHKNQNLRIVFMGTPDFAVSSLNALVENGYNIVGVVTAPDKPAGRGMNLRISPVKEYALAQNLHILQPDNLKDDAFLATLKKLNADLQVVVAFRMLPEVVWAMPPKGTFNLHASLLPQYRGAAPIHWAIANGETETGVTTFFLQHEIDTGDILLQEKVPILPSDNLATMYDKLQTIGAKMVVQTTQQIADGTITAFPQPQNETLRPAPKITKPRCRIDWNKSVQEIGNLIRGMSPIPCAWTEFELDGKRKKVKIFAAKAIIEKHQAAFGTILTEKDSLKIACADGFVQILDLQVEGKKRMAVEQYLKGAKEMKLVV